MVRDALRVVEWTQQRPRVVIQQQRMREAAEAANASREMAGANPLAGGLAAGLAAGRGGRAPRLSEPPRPQSQVLTGVALPRDRGMSDVSWKSGSDSLRDLDLGGGGGGLLAHQRQRSASSGDFLTDDGDGADGGDGGVESKGGDGRDFDIDIDVDVAARVGGRGGRSLTPKIEAAESKETALRLSKTREAIINKWKLLDLHCSILAEFLQVDPRNHFVEVVSILLGDTCDTRGVHTRTQEGGAAPTLDAALDAPAHVTAWDAVLALPFRIFESLDAATVSAALRLMTSHVWRRRAQDAKSRPADGNNNTASVAANVCHLWHQHGLLRSFSALAALLCRLPALVNAPSAAMVLDGEGTEAPGGAYAVLRRVQVRERERERERRREGGRGIMLRV